MKRSLRFLHLAFLVSILAVGVGCGGVTKPAEETTNDDDKPQVVVVNYECALPQGAFEGEAGLL